MKSYRDRESIVGGPSYCLCRDCRSELGNFKNHIDPNISSNYVDQDLASRFDNKRLS